MKSHSLFLILLTFSAVSFAHTANSSEAKRPGLVETRQNRAREIMEENFGAEIQIRDKATEKPSFGFLKMKAEDTQKL